MEIEKIEFKKLMVYLIISLVTITLYERWFQEVYILYLIGVGLIGFTIGGLWRLMDKIEQ